MTSVKPSAGITAIYSLRIIWLRRAAAFRDGNSYVCSPSRQINDSTYEKK